MDTGKVRFNSAVHCRPQPVRDSYPICVSYARIEVFNLLNLNQRAKMHIAYTEGRAETTRISEHCAVHCRPPCGHDFYRKSTIIPRNNVSFHFALSEPNGRNSCCVYGIILRDFENQWFCPSVKRMGGEARKLGAF
jgi:hypothetical protein